MNIFESAYRLSASPARVDRFAYPLRWPTNLSPLNGRLDVLNANFDVFKRNVIFSMTKYTTFNNCRVFTDNCGNVKSDNIAVHRERGRTATSNDQKGHTRKGCAPM